MPLAAQPALTQCDCTESSWSLFIACSLTLELGELLWWTLWVVVESAWPCAASCACRLAGQRME